MLHDSVATPANIELALNLGLKVTVWVVMDNAPWDDSEHKGRFGGQRVAELLSRGVTDVVFEPKNK